MPLSAPTCRAVFISYARDDTDAARRVADALRGFGIEVWFDQHELRGGDAWDAKIKRQIRECALFMPIVSSNTQVRSEGYFRREWKLGVERTHDMSMTRAFIVPVVIDETTQAHADTPEEFLRYQWTHLPGGVPSPQFVEQISRLLAPVSATEAGRPRALERGEAASSRPKPRATVLPWTGAALVVVGLVVGAFSVLQEGEPRAVQVSASFSPPPAAANPPLNFASAKSIAVLPFVNLGADKSDEYLGDGLTEELLNALCKVKGLRVPGRSSCFAFKGKTGEDIFRKVGEQLRVNTVLEGSVRRAGNKVRITAQLINVEDGFHLWSETYDRDLTDILAIQSDVAQQVVLALQLHLGGDEARALTKKPTENPEAHRLYLLGRFHFAKGTAAGWADAMRCFNEAIALDPGYALAYCGLADAYGWMPMDEMPGRIAWAREREMAEKALALDPALADAHLSLGIALADAFDWTGAEKTIARALELNPNLALGYDQQAWILTVFGRFDEGIAKQRRAIELDPLSPLMNRGLAVWLFFARRYDEAIAQARRTLELNPGSGSAQRIIGRCLLQKADYAAAIAALERASSMEPLPRTDAFLSYAYARSGNRAKAEEILLGLEALSARRYVSPGARVLVHLGLGDTARTLEWLERCYEEQDGTCWDLKVDPIYDPLRDEPRFKALLKKIGLEK